VDKIADPAHPEATFYYNHFFIHIHHHSFFLQSAQAYESELRIAVPSAGARLAAEECREYF